MKKEVLSAVEFLVDLIRINSTELSDDQLIKFRRHAYECLWQHYQDHWFPESPMKGSGYRCIRINGKMDPLIARAGELVGLAASSLRALFPSELTMWVDPSEVAYRIGENGSICNLYVVTAGVSSSNSNSTPKATAAPSETKMQLVETPTKPPNPKQAPPSSPQLSIQQLKQQRQQHFSPSKNPSSPPTVSQQYHSPPRSPVFNGSHQLSVQQQQHLAMFLMNNHNAVGNCKDSLRNSVLESSRGMERLFVSS